MVVEFYKTGLSGNIDLIIGAEDFLAAKYDEREWNHLKYATRAFALAGGCDYCIDHTDYMTIRGWIKSSKDCMAVFVLKEDPGSGTGSVCDVYVVDENGPQPVITCDEQGRECRMHRKRSQ